jgi:hypothetical protein
VRLLKGDRRQKHIKKVEKPKSFFGMGGEANAYQNKNNAFTEVQSGSKSKARELAEVSRILKRAEISPLFLICRRIIGWALGSVWQFRRQ